MIMLPFITNGDYLKKYKTQISAVLIVNLLSISFGAFLGWGSSAFVLFKSNESPLDTGPMSTSDLSWAGSVLSIGGLCGNILFGWISDSIGRKLSLIAAGVLMMVSWILALITKNLCTLIIARFIGGIAGAAVYALISVFTSEIAEDSIRGVLGSCLIPITNTGLLVAIILSDYWEYSMSPYIFIFITAVFLIATMWLPETPIYLMKNQREEEAEKSLRYYRNETRLSTQSEGFQKELQKLKDELLIDSIKETHTAITWKDFNNPLIRKIFLIDMGLMYLIQFCGCFAIINYTSNIFAESGSSLSPNKSSIIANSIQVIGSFTSVVLVEKAGRKLLLTTSAIGTACAHFCLGIYTYLNHLKYNMENVKWIPIASVSGVLLIASWGVGSLPLLLVAEISPRKIKNCMMAISVAVSWIFAFLILKYLPVLIETIGMYGCCLIFGLSCTAGVIFIVICIPETKGKSMEEILSSLEKRQK